MDQEHNPPGRLQPQLQPELQPPIEHAEWDPVLPPPHADGLGSQTHSTSTTGGFPDTDLACKQKSAPFVLYSQDGLSPRNFDARAAAIRRASVTSIPTPNSHRLSADEELEAQHEELEAQHEKLRHLLEKHPSKLATPL